MNKVEVTGTMQPIPMGNSLLQNLMERAGIGQSIGEKKEVSQTWSDLENIYQSIAESIVSVGLGIQQSIEIVKRYDIPQEQSYIQSILGAKRDLETFTQQMVNVKQRHVNKTGAVQSAEDLALCMDCFNEYVVIGDQFRAIMFPTLQDINEFTSVALSKMNIPDEEEQKLSDLQDPNVISDVESKEVKVD